MKSAQYQVEIPDYEYWKRQIPCQLACPVHTDARGYIQAIRHRQFEEGYLIARAPNPLASICGSICGAPCEAACRRGNIDKPVAIRALKRYATERYGAETYGESPQAFLHSLLNRTENLQNADEENLLAFTYLASTRPLRERKVAIVGGGPAGLAAAHDLALMGADVSVYEMERDSGGMLALGVPEFRLRREIIRAEVEVIQSLGVQMIKNTQVGTDVSMTQLRETDDAVIVAIGAKRSRAVPVPGGDAEGVLGGVDFLRDVSLGQHSSLGQKVVVIGGGNVAYDVARTVLRQIESDISRVALRQPFVKEVHVCCLESLEEMPADDTEIIEGSEEGIFRHNSLGPKEILVEDGHAVGVTFIKCLSVYDQDKKFAPVFDETQLTPIEADTVIVAVGQSVDLSCFEGVSGVEVSERGLVVINPETQMTTAPGIFMAGDAAHGTKLLIDAEASGKKVARSVFEYLTGQTLKLETTSQHVSVPGWSREKDFEKVLRTPIPTAAPESRIHSVSVPVELTYDEDSACQESSRCLDCGVNTIFDGDKCILCGGCADVCPESCIKLVSVTLLEGDKDLEKLIGIRFEGHALNDASAIIKDEDKCIRCGLCVERCPAGAITMERFTFSENWYVT